MSTIAYHNNTPAKAISNISSRAVITNEQLVQQGRNRYMELQYNRLTHPQEVGTNSLHPDYLMLVPVTPEGDLLSYTDIDPFKEDLLRYVTPEPNFFDNFFIQVDNPNIRNRNLLYSNSYNPILGAVMIDKIIERTPEGGPGPTESPTQWNDVVVQMWVSVLVHWFNGELYPLRYMFFLMPMQNLPPVPLSRIYSETMI